MGTQKNPPQRTQGGRCETGSVAYFMIGAWKLSSLWSERPKPCVGGWKSRYDWAPRWQLTIRPGHREAHFGHTCPAGANRCDFANRWALQRAIHGLARPQVLDKKKKPRRRKLRDATPWRKL